MFDDVLKIRIAKISYWEILKSIHTFRKGI